MLSRSRYTRDQVSKLELSLLVNRPCFSPVTLGEWPWAAVVDGNDNVWISNFALPSSPIVEVCGVRTEHCSPGVHTGEPSSPPGGYAGGGLQMQTDLSVDPAGNVWVMNNWQDIDSCIGTPKEALSTRCGGQGVVIFYGMAKAGTRPADWTNAPTVDKALFRAVRRSTE